MYVCVCVLYVVSDYERDSKQPGGETEVWSWADRQR